MEFIARRNRFSCFCLAFVILFLIQGCCHSEKSLPNSSYYDTGWSKGSMLEYQMLMDYERQKHKFSKISDKRQVYTDLYVIETNDTERMKNIYEKYGFFLIRKVFEDENYYLFRSRDRGKRHRRHAAEFIREIGQHSEIQWTSRQSLRDRVQRVISLHSVQDIQERLLFSEIGNLAAQETRGQRTSFTNPVFNDPLFKEQWYLYNEGQTGSPPRHDINVFPVWQSGITGRGVSISVLDDGVHGQNEEVAANYESEFSDEYLFRKTGLHPIPENSHGTRCAAVAAGVANNSVCGVGVAYESKVGGVRLLDGPLTDVQEALALVHALNHVDIYTASWGPTDKGEVVDGPKILARMAFVKGVTMGRQGRGSIYVWAAGNGGGYRDNCSLDGYASSPFTLTIGALTEDGRSTFYSEPCPAVIASTYVGGRSHTLSSRQAWNEDKKRIKVVVPEGRGKCKETFQGTSAAAPMAAGVVALALQANPDLTWRDVQHLIIRTSRVPTPREHGWLVNGAGFHFHPKIGSGVLDSYAIVTLARSWKSVGSLRVWTTVPERETRLLPPGKRSSIPIQILKSSMDLWRRVDRLETVIATISIMHGHRGELSMMLESPAGTSSPLLTKRSLDNDTSGFEHWDFVSLHFWGEDPDGVWTLRISNHHKIIEGFFYYMSITLYGTGYT